MASIKCPRCGRLIGRRRFGGACVKCAEAVGILLGPAPDPFEES